MTKYVVVFLIFVAALAGVLLYVGDDVRLIITSTAESGPLKMSPLDMSWQSVIVIGTLGVFGVLAIWTLFGWLWRLPSRLKYGVGLRRRNQALDALEDALIAGAEGDISRSRKKSEKARELIKSKALGQMISAQAADAAGDSEQAIHHYTAMLEDEKTKSIGQRGLAQQLLATGDLSGAIHHAGLAYANNKSARWALDVLFQAQVQDHRWHNAKETLELADHRKHIDKDVFRRRRAVLMTAEADRLAADGDADAARDLAVTAAQDMPQFAPGVARAANLLTKNDNAKKAAALIEKAWASAPHPALAVAYRDIYVNESDRVRAKKMASLVKSNPDHRESIILKAEEALHAGDGVTAWSALSPLMQINEPSARLCLLAAQAEAMLKNQADAAVWTECAATAPSEPDWADLDPEGAAFEYSDQDWRRLVYTFGDRGELIHPRFEQGASTRAVVLGRDSEKPESEKDPDVKPQRQPDDPGSEVVSEDDDLALRLDSLLGDEETKA